MGKALDLNFRLNRPQFEAFQAIKPGRTIFTGFGRGVGKSWFHRFVWWTFVAQMDGKVRLIDADGMVHRRKGVSIGVMMPTLKQFKDVHAEGIQEELALDGPWGFLGGSYDKQSGKVTFPGGSTVTPFPAAEHTSKKARGPRVDIASCDEVDDIPAEVHDGILVPWMSAPWSLNIEISGGTPTRGRHGLWWRTLEMGRLGEKLRNGATPEELDIDPADAEAFESVYSFHAWYKHAPETVSPRAVAKAKATTPKATFEREWEANPDAGEGLVYPFDDQFHIGEPPPDTVWTEMLIGCDHGWEDPGVLLLIGVIGTGRDAICWVLDEVYEQHRSEDWWVDRAALWCRAYPNHKFYGDPSMPARIDAFKRRSGARIQKVDNSIDDGIAAVANRLFINQEDDEDGNVTRRWSRFSVTRRCPNTIREFGLYRRKKRADGTFSEGPEDKHNHAMDAVRYPIFNRFGPVDTSKRSFRRYDQR